MKNEKKSPGSLWSVITRVCDGNKVSETVARDRYRYQMYWNRDRTAISLLEQPASQGVMTVTERIDFTTEIPVAGRSLLHSRGAVDNGSIINIVIIYCAAVSLLVRFRWPFPGRTCGGVPVRRIAVYNYCRGDVRAPQCANYVIFVSVLPRTAPILDCGGGPRCPRA